MEQQTQQVLEWLKGQEGQTLVIEKNELDDRDVVYFELNGVDVREEGGSIDDYLEPALILQGYGSTENADGDLVQLPGETYEIVTAGLSVSRSQDSGVELQTDRARYSLSLSEQ